MVARNGKGYAYGQHGLQLLFLAPVYDGEFDQPHVGSVGRDDDPRNCFSETESPLACVVVIPLYLNFQAEPTLSLGTHRIQVHCVDITCRHHECPSQHIRSTNTRTGQHVELRSSGRLLRECGTPPAPKCGRQQTNADWALRLSSTAKAISWDVWPALSPNNSSMARRSS